MKVLYVTSEAAPFAKSGGLGDVAGSLPQVLNEQKETVRVMMPLYQDIPQIYKDQMETVTTFTVQLNWRQQPCEIKQLSKGNTVYYFVKNDYYYNREGLYGFFDEAERYLFFSKAILEFVPQTDFWPDIIHCNDWQTAMVPFLLEKHYHQHYQDLKTVLTIHNIKYQGIYGKETLYDILGLTPSEITEDIEFKDATNMMKAGIYNADWVTTVSPTYAKELGHSYFGQDLHGVIKSNQHKLTGILNGIDYQSNNPATDENLYVNYTRSIVKKQENKRQFLEEMGMLDEDKRPLVGIVSRLDELKGIDLITHVIYEMMGLGINLVVLGTGDKKYEDVFHHIRNSFPSHTSVHTAFDSKLASKIYASSDMILMPSRVEPCGLTQMIALAYGAVPLVRKTGGLNDTIEKFNVLSGEGNGFVFNNYNAHEMLAELTRAVCLYKRNEPAWRQVVNNAFQSRFDWQKSAQAYGQIYRKIKGDN